MKGLSVVLTGEAGQGLKTIEALLTKCLKKTGYHVHLSKEYMSRIRGGNNTTQIRVADCAVSGYVHQTDIVIVLGPQSLARLEERISSETLIIGDPSHIEESYRQGEFTVRDLPLKQTSKDCGGALFINSVVFGLLCSLLDVSAHIRDQELQTQFGSKGEDLIKANIAAADAGSNLRDTIEYTVDVKPGLNSPDYSLLSGTEAIGIGALAGSCNFVTAYPMSPSTGVLAYMAQQAADFEVIVEQAEDEISAINMVQGAWYAGARAMTTTSGGGFALMGEGLSLAGMTETPAVIHLAQRPGPATGLPTRTEQGDLNLAVYSGHGEFPRVVLAPGTLEQGIRLTQCAFNTADRYQVPVIILTDQYYVDHTREMATFPINEMTIENHVIETEENYKRYSLDNGGISPRGIPGFGNGLICSDSDEHDEVSRITEDFAVRVAMNEKRLNKLSSYEDIPVSLSGDENYHTLIVGWGSTYGPVTEALNEVENAGVAFAHCAQVFPVPKELQSIMDQAAVCIAIENNATGQFADLVQLHTGQTFDHRVLKYNGMPFAVEEVVEYIQEVVK